MHLVSGPQNGWCSPLIFLSHTKIRTRSREPIQFVYRSATLARLKSLIYQAGLPPDTSLLEESINSNRVSTIQGFHSPSKTRVNRVDKQTCFQVHAVVRADQASNGRVARYMIARKTALLRLCLRVIKSGLFICQGSRVAN